MNEENKTERVIYERHFGWCCCAPIGRLGVLFWGFALMIVGFVWLLSNYGLIPGDWWRVLFPLLLIGLGFFYLLSTREAGGTD
ncbi:MAG: LiaI-LiaF-like domain-containing protein [bacterium]